jgi:hypothetical protein
MKQGILFYKILVISLLLLVASPGATMYAQHRHSDPITGHGISGKKVKQKSAKEKKIIIKDPASKKVRAQEKKAEKREKQNARADSKLKSHHFAIQTPETQWRMINNQKRTSFEYKEKHKKIRRESHKPRRQQVQKP